MMQKRNSQGINVADADVRGRMLDRFALVVAEGGKIFFSFRLFF